VYRELAKFKYGNMLHPAERIGTNRPPIVIEYRCQLGQPCDPMVIWERLNDGLQLVASIASTVSTLSLL
jgi:hypothetical protein